ncbi:MAG: DUF6078 family protein [Bacteroides sp.]
MKSDFDYSSVPYDFAHCFIEQCPLATECLRHQVALHVSPQCETLTIVNPAIPAHGTNSCPYFKTDKLVHYASGISSLLNNLIYAEAISIKQRLLDHFGRNTYYRFKRKERLISPSEQAYISQLFRDKGITEEPKYDEYVDQYDW